MPVLSETEMSARGLAPLGDSDFARWRTSRATCFLPASFRGKGGSWDSVSGDSTRSHLARGGFDAPHARPSIRRRVRTRYPRVTELLKKCRSCLTAAAACGGWGEDRRRAGSRASRFDRRTGARGGPDGYTRHRDRGADSGGRHGDGRRLLGSQWLPGKTHKSFSSPFRSG